VIRSKDNKERPILANWPRGPNFLTNDPLVRAYPGTVEFWHIEEADSCSSSNPRGCDGDAGEGQYRWVRLGIADCTGKDIGSSDGSADPQA